MVRRTSPAVHFGIGWASQRTRGCRAPVTVSGQARNRLRGPVQTVHLLWQNRFRFFSEDRLRAHLKALAQNQRGVNRGADFGARNLRMLAWWW